MLPDRMLYILLLLFQVLLSACTLDADILRRSSELSSTNGQNKGAVTTAFQQTSPVHFYYNGVGDFAVDASGNMIVGDSYNHIRKFTLGGPSSVTIAGGGPEWVDGIGENAGFRQIRALKVRNGDIYVLDGYGGDFRLRKVSAAGVVTTISTATEITNAVDFAVDSTGKIFVTASVAMGGPYRVYQINTSTGAATSVVSDPTYSMGGIVIDSHDDIFITYGTSIAKVLSNGTLTVVAGNPSDSNLVDGAGTAARFSSTMSSLCIDANDNIYTTDDYNRAMRKVTPAYVVSTLFTQTDYSSQRLRVDFYNGYIFRATTSGSFARYDLSGTEEIIPGVDAGDLSTNRQAYYLASVDALSIDIDGNFYTISPDREYVQKINPSSSQVTVLAGVPGDSRYVAGTLSQVRFKNIQSIATDKQGNLFVADIDFPARCLIRKIAVDGTVTDFAGSTSSCGTTDGVGASAKLGIVLAMAADGAGNLYVADQVEVTSATNDGCSSSLVRKIAPNGTVTTLVGNEATLCTVNDGVGANATFSQPKSLVVDSKGEFLYLVDSNGYYGIREINLTTKAVTTHLASENSLSGVNIVIDSFNNIYVAPSAGAGRFGIYKIDSSWSYTSFSGSVNDYGNVNGNSSDARFEGTNILAIDGFDSIYVGEDFKIRKVE